MNSINEFAVRLWKEHSQMVREVVEKLNQEDLDKRIHPEAATAGFYLLHLLEVEQYSFSEAFGVKGRLGASSFAPNPNPAPTVSLQAMLDEIAWQSEAYVKPLSEIANEAWEDKITLPFGVYSRFEILTWTLNHSAHHCGQIAQAAKRGV